MSATTSFNTFNSSAGVYARPLGSHDDNNNPADAASNHDQQARLQEMAAMAAMKRKEADALEAKQRFLGGGGGLSVVA